MPFYKITLIQGAYRASEEIIDAVRRGNTAAGYPANDVFQRVEELPASRLIIDGRYPDLPRERTSRLIVFEILTSAGTASEQKDRIRTSVVQSLAEIAVDPNDVIMFFVDYDRTTSSFGGGRTPPPIRLEA